MNCDVLRFLDSVWISTNTVVVAEEDLDALLYLAVQSGEKEAAVQLLQEGAHVNARFQGGTPLMLAAARGNVEMMRTLISAGADLDAASEDGIRL